MLTFHNVELDYDLIRGDALFVGNFFKLRGMWWTKRKQRQGLILSIAVAWYRSMQQNKSAPGFIEEEVLITSLTRQVKDAKVILEYFFDINRVGFNFPNGLNSPTLISPKKLSKKLILAIESIINVVRFSPGQQPDKKELYNISYVKAQTNKTEAIKKKLTDTQREDLWPACQWLLSQTEQIPFYYTGAGKLQAREKSVWPIKSIETWPGWLRELLFGETIIDIENSYFQFMMQKLELKYANDLNLLKLKYPDLVRADKDKQNFREELCKDYLKLPVNTENLKVVKKLIMALANGSNATAGLMAIDTGRSEAVAIVHQAIPDMLPSDSERIGNRLSVLTRQFKAAKRDLCIYLLNEKPTRLNQKKIFQQYFIWERQARHAIWNATGNTGLMMHDGIDGIISNKSEKELMHLIAHQTSLKVSVDKSVNRLKEVTEYFLYA
jgi:hypothetical protein